MRSTWRNAVLTHWQPAVRSILRPTALTVLFAVSFSTSVLAVEVPGLFNADIPAADDSQAERLRAEALGLSGVLIKLSGKTSILSAPAVTAALHNPETYLLQFAMATNPDSEPTQPRLFRFRFDPRAVTQLLKNNRLPLWSTNRPPLLIWCVDDAGNLISRSTLSAWQKRLQQNASRRGLPLLFPFADQQDQSALKTDDVAASSSERINVASLRYIAGPGTGVVLAVKINNSGGWNAQSILLLDGKGSPIQIQAASENELAQRLMDYAADNIADRYALALTSAALPQGQVRLVVDNINNFTAASQLGDYLRKVTAIKSARLVSVAGSTATYELNLEGDSAQMKQAVQLDQKLQPSDTVGATDLSEMHFNWNNH